MNIFIYAIPNLLHPASFYWDNLIHSEWVLKKFRIGNYTIAFLMGDIKLAGIAAEDIGKCALGIFKKGEKYIGKIVGIAGDHLTGNEMADKIFKELGKDVIDNEVSPDVCRSFYFPSADDL